MLGKALLGSSPRPELAFLTNFMVETDMHKYTHSPWCERWKSPVELLNVGVLFTEEKGQGSPWEGGEEVAKNKNFILPQIPRMRNLDGESGLQPRETGL